MLNNVVMVGRLVSDPQINETENGRKVTTITLAVNRSFKNVDGIYETDFIPCILWDGVAGTTKEYCHEGDVVGIKGRLQSRDGKVEVVAERVTFLKSGSKESDEE